MKKTALFIFAAALSISVISSCTKTNTCTCDLKLTGFDTTFTVEYEDADLAKEQCAAFDKQYQNLGAEAGSCEL